MLDKEIQTISKMDLHLLYKWCGVIVGWLILLIIGTWLAGLAFLGFWLLSTGIFMKTKQRAYARWYYRVFGNEKNNGFRNRKNIKRV